MKRTASVPVFAALAVLLAVTACGDTTYEFDKVGVGDDDQGRTPRERTNSQFLRAVYADLLGRAPQTYDFVVSDGVNEFAFPIDEQAQLLDVLDALGDSTPMRDLLVTGLVFSTEVDIPDKADVDDPEEFISEQFRRFLGRNPSAYELRAFMDEWDSDDSVNPRTIIRALIGSNEYQSF